MKEVEIMQPAFISYSSKDADVANSMCEFLEKNDIKCWMAPRDIVPGKEWAEAIIESLDSCSAFILIFSQKSNDSPQVLREVERAVNKRIPLIPFRVENIPPSKALEYFISTNHWLNAFDRQVQDHLPMLLSTLKKIYSGENPANLAGQGTPMSLEKQSLQQVVLSPSRTEDHKEFLVQLKKNLTNRKFFENSVGEAVLVTDELLANAVKHGCKDNPDGKIEITCEVSDSFLRVKITDPGQGFNYKEILESLNANPPVKIAGRGLRTAHSLSHRLEFSRNGACVEAVILNKAEIVQEKMALPEGGKAIGNVIALKFKGYFDNVMGADLVNKVKSLIKKKNVRIVLDLEEVEVINSQGIAAVLEAVSLLEENEGRMVFANLSSLIEKMFKLTFGDDLNYDTLDEAVKSFEA